MRVLSIVSLLLSTTLLWAELAATTNTGSITALSLGGDWLEARTRLALPLAGWSRVVTLDDARGMKTTREAGRRTWQGNLKVAEGQTCHLQQTLTEQGQTLDLQVTLTADTALTPDGVYFFLSLPRAALQGGQGVLLAGGKQVAAATLPVEQPPQRHFLQGSADAATLASADGRTKLQMTFDRALPATIQDTREWQGGDYDLFVRLGGPLQAGQSVSLGLRLEVIGEADRRAAQVTVDETKPLQPFAGFGGNYCFQLDSPVTRYTLEHLRSAWARTEMSLALWAADSDLTPEHLAQRDTPGSRLRQEFELMREIQRRGMPYVISIWNVPTWLVEPETATLQQRQRIPQDKWPQMAEAIGQYLLYAKRQYGVEPNLFSFNEPNLGVRVLWTAPEHREVVKLLGSHFKALGLKTKLLLADATGPRGTYPYALPAADDPEARQFLGAVGFHSWGGGSAQDYQAWGDLARRLDLPLLVTEVGVDSGAWKTGVYDNYHYALQELRMWQELLLYARPQALVQWEFTPDYSLIAVTRDAAGKPVLTPTPRFYLAQHWCNLNPPGAVGMSTTSDHPQVLLTALRGQIAGRPAWTLHLANLGAAREVTITGLPRSVSTWRVIRTSETEQFQQLEAVSPRRGKLRLSLPAGCLVSLTTLPANDL